MRAGQLDHHIRVLNPVLTRNSYGEDIPSWKELAKKVPAGVLAVSGNERWIAQQVIARAEFLFKIRYLKGITPKSVIEYDPGDGTGVQQYNVLSALPVGRNEGLMVAAETRADAKAV